MIEIVFKIIITALTTEGIFIIIDKYSLIDKWSFNARFKITRKVLECNFCSKHHLGILVVLILGIFMSYKMSDLMVPFWSSSVISLISNRNNERI